MENLDWLISSAGFRTAGTLPLDRLRRQIAVRNTAGPVSDIRNINFVGLQHAKLADGPGPEFGFGFCSGPYSDGCGSNSAIRTGKYFFYATKFASSVGWTDDQYDVVDGYISVRFGPFRSRVEFRHDLLEPSMPEMGDEDLRCSPPFFG